MGGCVAGERAREGLIAYERIETSRGRSLPLTGGTREGLIAYERIETKKKTTPAPNTRELARASSHTSELKRRAPHRTKTTTRALARASSHTSELKPLLAPHTRAYERLLARASSHTSELKPDRRCPPVRGDTFGCAREGLIAYERIETADPPRNRSRSACSAREGLIAYERIETLSSSAPPCGNTSRGPHRIRAN